MSFEVFSSSRSHLLLIDDRIDELQLLLGVMRNSPLRISLAFDAWQGYLRACALRPDLIVLDMHMKGMDGLGVCRLLKADPSTARIPLIFVTANTSLDVRLEALRSGAVDFVLKPFDAAEVMARIGIHLSLAARTSASAPEPEEPVGGSNVERTDRVIVRAAIDFLDGHLMRSPSLAQIAAKVGTHERRLSRAFRANTGKTVFEFLREARLSRAQRLLAQSPLSVQQIAAEVGFPNPANFATAFRRRFGMTPRAARLG